MSLTILQRRPSKNPQKKGYKKNKHGGKKKKKKIVMKIPKKFRKFVIGLVSVQAIFIVYFYSTLLRSSAPTSFSSPQLSRKELTMQDRLKIQILKPNSQGLETREALLQGENPPDEIIIRSRFDTIVCLDNTLFGDLAKKKKGDGNKANNNFDDEEFCVNLKPSCFKKKFNPQELRYELIFTPNM